MKKPDKTDRTQWVYNTICDDTIVKVYANLVPAYTLPKLLYIHRVYLEYGGYGGYCLLKKEHDKSKLWVSNYQGNVDWKAVSNTLRQQVVPQEAASILNSDEYLSKAKNKNLLKAFEDNWEHIYLYSYEVKSREALIEGIARVLTSLYGKDIDLMPINNKELDKSMAMFALYRVLLEEATALENQIECKEENKDYDNWCNFETFQRDWLKLQDKKQQNLLYDFKMYYRLKNKLSEDSNEEEITMSDEDNKDYCDCCNCEASKQIDVWAKMKRKGMYTPDDFNFFRNLGKQPPNNKEE